MGFQEDRWENVLFLSKPRHMIPQIDHLGKMSLVMRVSTHIYGVSKKTDGKMLNFWVNLGMWPLKLIVLEIQTLFWEFQTHIYGVLQEMDGKTFIFRVNLGMCLKSIVLEKQALFCRFQHTFIKRQIINLQSTIAIYESIFIW